MQMMDTQPARGAQQPPKQTPPAAGKGAPGLPAQALSPEQTRKMQLMSKQAMSMLLEDTSAQQIVQMAQQGDPQRVVVDVVVTVLQRLYEAGAAVGQMSESPEDVVTLLVTGVQIIGDLTEMLIAAGVLQQAQAQEFIATTARMAVDQHNAQLQGGAQQQRGGV